MPIRAVVLALQRMQTVLSAACFWLECHGLLSLLPVELVLLMWTGSEGFAHVATVLLLAMRCTFACECAALTPLLQQRYASLFTGGTVTMSLLSTQHDRSGVFTISQMLLADLYADTLTPMQADSLACEQQCIVAKPIKVVCADCTATSWSVSSSA